MNLVTCVTSDQVDASIALALSERYLCAGEMMTQGSGSGALDLSHEVFLVEIGIALLVAHHIFLPHEIVIGMVLLPS